MSNDKNANWIIVRFESSDKQLVRKVARSQRTDVSAFVRGAVFREIARLGFLPQEQAKALGVSP